MTQLLYHTDTSARTHTSTVLEMSQRDDVVEVLLASTIFYPTGGGQPHDIGTIDGLPVVDVAKIDGQVWHHVQAPAGALAVGDKVSLAVEWSRRWDHMQQHSAQHLITALAEDLFGWSTLSFHLGASECTIELNTPSCAPGEIIKLQQHLAEAISAAHPITSRVIDVEDARGMTVRSRGLPSDHRGDVRLVEIQGVDLNTCGGTHVGSTAELQLILLMSTTKRRKNMLLTFLAGQRALDQTRAWIARDEQLNRLLSCGPPQYIERIEHLQGELKQSNATIRSLQDQLAKSIALSLCAKSAAVITYHVDGGMPMLQAINKHLNMMLVDDDPRLFVLVSGQDEGPFLARGASVTKAAVRDHILSTLNARGGGRPPMFQGQAKSLDQLALLQQRLEEEHQGQS